MSTFENKFVISFSGQNGCGKSTIINMIRDQLDLEGVKCEVFKAPDYTTTTGQKIKAFLDGEQVDDIEELFH